jgi:chitin disaccharide deacetylase
MPDIILCADDYAQTDAISNGIINLVKNNRLSAVSCMTTSRYWPAHAALLKPYADTIDVGLHFNLTEGAGLADHPQFIFAPIGSLLAAAFFGRLNREAIMREFCAQLTAFCVHFGKMPDFIDGHQHVHHLPTIREAILTVYQQELMSQKPYLRISSNNYLTCLRDYKNFPKTQIICFTGAMRLKKRLQQLNIPHNQNFAGIYNFSQSEHYRDYFHYFITQVKNGGLIMCHPGLASNERSDPLYQSRIHEYNYFLSADFLADCAANDIVLARFER